MKRADPRRVKRAQPTAGKNLTRKNGCGNQTAGSSFRKGRSRDKVAGRNEDPRSCTATTWEARTRPSSETSLLSGVPQMHGADNIDDAQLEAEASPNVSDSPASLS